MEITGELELEAFFEVIGLVEQTFEADLEEYFEKRIKEEQKNSLTWG